MNILASYRWIKEFVRTDLPPEDFARELSLAGLGVERVHRLGENLEKVLVASIVEIRPHPNADRLRVVVVDTGNGRWEVVCGGSNLSVGMKIAFADVGSRVRWHGEGELVPLAPADIRGVKSSGMICAASEIGLGEWFPAPEREILDLSWLDHKNGTPLQKALELDDVLFDIEITTNRPDALAIRGIAREASAILRAKLLPGPADRLPKPSRAKGGRPLKVTVKEGGLCSRYQAALVENVRVGESPWWLRLRLLGAGIRPISNIVDITNYVMLETGQPLHAFDADKLDGQEIVVRRAKKGERLRALDGRDYDFTEEMLVIADRAKPVALAGVIGGEESAVTASTTRVIFESAAFDPVSVRRASRGFALHTDAALRFEKGLSAEGTAPALTRAIALANQIAEGNLALPVVDTRRGSYRALRFPFDPAEATALIGVSVTPKEAERILSDLGFELKKERKAGFMVTVPWWREHDIEGARDFVEEIARIKGYHTLPSILPEGAPPLRAPDPELVFEDELKTLLAHLGATELVTYTFVSEELLSLVSREGATAVRVANPLSSDFVAMRTSLLPSMLQVIRENQAERPEALYFESGRVYLDQKGEDALPHEPLELLVAATGASPNGEQFRRVKGFLDRIAKEWNIPYSLLPTPYSLPKHWHPGRSAEVVINGKAVGVVGELHPDLLARFGIDRRAAMFEIPLAALVSAREVGAFAPIPAFPAVKRDISFLVDRSRTHDALAAAMREAAPLQIETELFDVYEGKGVPEGKKSMAFHLAFRLNDRTLTSEEVDTALGSIVVALEKNFGAAVRSEKT